VSIGRPMTWDELAAENERLKAEITRLRKGQCNPHNCPHCIPAKCDAVQAARREGEAEAEIAGLKAYIETSHAEAETITDNLRADLAAAEQREAGYRDALERIKEYAGENNYLVVMLPIEEFCADALSQPSPGAERWRALVEMVKQAMRRYEREDKGGLSTRDGLAWAMYQDLSEALGVLEGVSGD